MWEKNPQEGASINAFAIFKSSAKFNSAKDHTDKPESPKVHLKNFIYTMDLTCLTLQQFLSLHFINNKFDSSTILVRYKWQVCYTTTRRTEDEKRETLYITRALWAQSVNSRARTTDTSNFENFSKYLIIFSQRLSLWWADFKIKLMYNLLVT